MAVMCFRCLKLTAAMAGVACSECADKLLEAQKEMEKADVMKEADGWEEWRVRHYDFAVRHRPLDA